MGKAHWNEGGGNSAHKQALAEAFKLAFEGAVKKHIAHLNGNAANEGAVHHGFKQQGFLGLLLKGLL